METGRYSRPLRTPTDTSWSLMSPVGLVAQRQPARRSMSPMGHTLDPNSQRQCKYEEVFCIGRVEDKMVLTSERHQIEDLILTISYAEFRQELAHASTA